MLVQIFPVEGLDPRRRRRNRVELTRQAFDMRLAFDLNPKFLLGVVPTLKARTASSFVQLGATRRP